MSVSSAQSALRQVEAEIGRIEKKKSADEKKASDLDAKISQYEADIRKTSNASIIRSKQSQIDRWITERNRAKKEAADAGTKLSGLSDRKRKAETTLRTEQQKENEQESRKLQNRIDELTSELQSNVCLREPNMIMQCVRPLIERFPDAFELFERAEEKYESGENDRNALDDMRLCFELVLKSLFSNEKNLENQLDVVGRMMKAADLSEEYRNTFRTLLDYYCKYQNHHVKHDENINPHEVSFIIEMTCIMMKQLIEVFGQE